MKAIKKSVLVAAVSAALGFASAAQAGVVIDLFQDPVGGEQKVSTEILGATVNDQNPFAFPTTSVIGGYRDLSIKKTGDIVGAGTIGDNTGAATLAAAAGALSFSNAAGVSSVAVITWDGSNPAGNLGAGVVPTGFGGVGIDLTAGGTADTIFADVLLADLGFNYKITVWDMDGDKSVLSAGVQFQVASTVSSHYAFSWFDLPDGQYCDGVIAPPLCANPLTQLDFSIVHTGGPIDFTRIGALQLELTSPVGLVGSFDLALGTVETVPEPGALALVGIALLGAGVAARRTKVVKA